MRPSHQGARTFPFTQKPTITQTCCVTDNEQRNHQSGCQQPAAATCRRFACLSGNLRQKVQMKLKSTRVVERLPSPVVTRNWPIPDIFGKLTADHFGRGGLGGGRAEPPEANGR